MAESNGRTRVILVGLAIVAIGVAVGYWRALPPGDAVAPAEVPTAGEPRRDGVETMRAPAPSPGPARAPEQRISDKGRIKVSLEALRDGDGFAIALSMPDVNRGDGPRPVRVIDAAGSGRVYDAEAVPIEGAGTGVRLDIDAEWLRPGRYMIQVETAEKFPMAIRRYVLEVE